MDFDHIFKVVFKVREDDVEFPLVKDIEVFNRVEVVDGGLIWKDVGVEFHDEYGNPTFFPYQPDTIVLYENSTADTTRDLDFASMIRSLRQEQGLTQTELAEKSGTTKQYISRLENSHADIELLTLKRIVEGGLGRHLEIRVK